MEAAAPPRNEVVLERCRERQEGLLARISAAVDDYLEELREEGSLDDQYEPEEDDDGPSSG